METATYYSPSGNPERCYVGEQPEGYTPEAEWLAAHPPKAPEPDPEAERLAGVETIKSKMRELDAASIRPLRAIADGAATDEDRDWLERINKKTEALRAELREMEAAMNG